MSKLKIILSYVVVSLLSFAVGLVTCFFFAVDIGNRNHAREETKMAAMNRDLAIKNGDKNLQRYFEDVIIWNTINHLSPEFRKNKPLIVDQSWIFPERPINYNRYQRSKGDWQDEDMIAKGIKDKLIQYDKKTKD